LTDEAYIETAIANGQYTYRQQHLGFTDGERSKEEWLDFVNIDTNFVYQCNMFTKEDTTIGLGDTSTYCNTDYSSGCSLNAKEYVQFLHFAKLDWEEGDAAGLNIPILTGSPVIQVEYQQCPGLQLAIGSSLGYLGYVEFAFTILMLGLCMPCGCIKNKKDDSMKFTELVKTFGRATMAGEDAKSPTPDEETPATPDETPYPETCTPGETGEVVVETHVQLGAAAKSQETEC